MKRIVTALILIPLVLLLVFLGPGWQWLFTLAVARWLRWLDGSFWSGGEDWRYTAARCGVIVILATVCQQPLLAGQAVAIRGILGLGLLLLHLLPPADQVLAAAATSIFCLFYVGFTLMTLPPCWRRPTALAGRIPAVRCLGATLPPLCRQRLGPAQDGYRAEPEQILGGRSWLGGRQSAGDWRPAGSGQVLDLWIRQNSPIPTSLGGTGSSWLW